VRFSVLGLGLKVRYSAGWSTRLEHTSRSRLQHGVNRFEGHIPAAGVEENSAVGLGLKVLYSAVGLALTLG